VLDPIPTESELQTFYATATSEFWNSSPFSILQDYVANPGAVRRYYWRDRIQHIRREFPHTLKPNTAALDVGCSSGAFVATLRDLGLNASGQDIAGPAVAAGVEKLGLRLASEPITELTAKADLVTCYDVIEHWPNPAVLVKPIRAICNPGAAVVIRTPNHASWLRVMTRKNWLWSPYQSLYSQKPHDSV
jgi:2-polyprenyl-3-methyl-5-hydroxy-6-metoxy-1,4-benzoquinol methylase